MKSTYTIPLLGTFNLQKVAPGQTIDGLEILFVAHSDWGNWLIVVSGSYPPTIRRNCLIVGVDHLNDVQTGSADA